MKEKLQILDIAEAKVPKNMTHLLQPLDLTANGTAQKIEKREFSSYFTKRIMQAMLKDGRTIDVTTIDVDLKVSTLKPLHAATVIKVYNFKIDVGYKIILSGWRAAGITEALKKAREPNTIPSLNPYDLFRIIFMPIFACPGH